MKTTNLSLLKNVGVNADGSRCVTYSLPHDATLEASLRLPHDRELFDVLDRAETTAASAFEH